RIADARRRGRARKHVVDAPADVSLPRAAPLPPPGVMTGLSGMARTERVDPARGDPAGELGALLGQKAARLRIVLRPGEVDLLVCRVEVADHQHAAQRPKPLDALECRAVEVELVRNAAVVAVLAAALRE